MARTKMKCFECQSGTFEHRFAAVEGQIKGEKFNVETMALVCSACGHIALEGEDTPEYMRRLADAYRASHGLLTSDEIRQLREELGLSQAKFAAKISVGVASVKRWEWGLVQDKAMDELIRLKADPEAARRNLNSLESELSREQHVFTIGDIELTFFPGEQHYSERMPMSVDRSEIPWISDSLVVAA